MLARRILLVLLTLALSIPAALVFAPSAQALPPTAVCTQSGSPPSCEVNAAGTPTPSAQRYRWVDSTAPGCKAPSIIGPGLPVPGAPTSPARGCPVGWDEIAGAGCKIPATGDSTGQASSGGCLISCCSYSFNFYGSGWYPQNWYVNENGFIDFNPYGAYCGTATRNPVQMPTGTSASGCSSSATAHPEEIVAGFWTNLKVITPATITTGLCWDYPAGPTTDAQHVWVSNLFGSSPNRYAVIEFDRVLVNSNDAGCLASPNPNHYATFEFKIWLERSTVDVIYKSVDTNGQAYSLGIENSAGTVGLNYCSPTVAGACAAPSGNLVDRAVRYYPNHSVLAFSGSVPINEDCAPATPAPVAYDCSATRPDWYGNDPDYGDAAPSSYCIQTSPTRGTLTAGLPACSSGTYAVLPAGFQYTPFLNFNTSPVDSYQFKVKHASDGGTAGPATVTMNPTRPINDAPTGYDHSYTVLSGDSRYVTPSQGVDVEFPAAALNAPTDPEAPPQRNTWGCSTAPPSGTPSCTAAMADGAPVPTLTAAMLACPGYDATWLPQHGTVTFVDVDAITKPGIHPNGSFNYQADPFVGADSFRFCMYDGTDYQPASVVSKVNLNLISGVAGFTAHSDSYSVDEDGGPLVAQDAAAPAANDDASACSGGLEFRVISGSGPAGAASFAWNTPGGNFAYTPLPDWAGDDSLSYQMYCPTMPPGSEFSNVASVRIRVLAINDQPIFNSGWKAFGDLINEDNGVVGPSTPPVFNQVVTNFMTGISPAGGADELASQTVRAVIVSQSNTGLFTSVVPCPANYDFGMVAAACPATLGPALEMSGAIGSQVLTLKYSTKPDANGSDSVCFRLMDNGGTALGGRDQNPMPPTAPLCFVIKISAVPDDPRPVADTYTIYQGHELFAPAPAVAFPPGQVQTFTVLQGNPNPATPDVEVDGEALAALIATPPALGNLWYLNSDGSFHYSPPPGVADARVNDLSPNLNKPLKMFAPTSVSSIGGEKFYNQDGSFDGFGPTFTAPDTAYLDLDSNNLVSVRDLRLTPFGALAASTVVAAADPDAGFALAPTAHTATCYADSDHDGTPDANEPIYLQVQACGPASLSSNDIRMSAGGPLPGGRIMASSDPDLGAATHAVATKYCYVDKDNSGTYNAGDPLYLDLVLNNCSFVTPGDVIFAPAYTGAQTFTYYAQDTSGAKAVATVTIVILPNSPPIGTMSASSLQAEVGSQLSFGSTCSDADPADTTLLSTWDFGDGYSTIGANPVHTFAAPGTFAVTFICYDPHGDYWVKTISILVSMPQVPVDQNGNNPVTPDPGPGTTPLVANAGEDQQVGENGKAVLSGTASGGSPTTWTWHQVAGPAVTLQDGDKPSASFQAPTLAAGKSAVLVFQLVVGDGTQESLPDSVAVTVLAGNHPPTLVVGPRQMVHEGDLVTLDALASTDPDGDSLTFKWTQASGPAVLLASAETAKPTFTVPSGALGQTLVFAVEASDGRASSVDSVPVAVVAQVFEGPGFSAQVAGDGTVTVTPAAPGTTFVWDFGDLSAPVASDGPATHTYAKSGSYTIRLTASDASGTVREFQQGVPVKVPSGDDGASRPEVQTTASAPVAIAWGLVAGGVLLTAAVVGLAFYVKRRKK
ncbi:MAG: PKD domain-containing protein [bacterium]